MSRRSMEVLLKAIGQMKDTNRSQPTHYYKRIEKKNGRGHTYFYTKGEYDRYMRYRNGSNR